MAIKDQVQGVVLALLGAAAGSHLADLTKQATGGSIGGLAGGLVGLQGLLTGKDLSKNADWIKDMLANVGLKEGTAAHTEATTWATAQLTAGASRADVVVAAVDYLLAPTGQSAAFQKLATAFQGDVAASITWSEGAVGSKVVSYAALKTATVAVRDTVVEVFGDYVASTKGLTDALIEAGKVVGTAKVAAGNTTSAAVVKSMPADSNGDKTVSAAELKAYSEAFTAATLTAEATAAKNALTAATGALETARAVVTSNVLQTDAALAAAVTKAQAAVTADTTAKALETAIATAKKAVADDVIKNGTDGSILSTVRSQLVTMLGLTDDVVNSVTGISSGDAIGGSTVGAIMDMLNAGSSASSTVSITPVGGSATNAKAWLAANPTKSFADFQTLVLNKIADTLGAINDADFANSAVKTTIATLEARATLNNAVTTAQSALDGNTLGAALKAATDAVATRKILVDNVADLTTYAAATAAQAKLVADADAANTAVLARFTGLELAAPETVDNGDLINSSQVKGVYINKLKAAQTATFDGFSSNDTLYLGDYTVKTLTAAEAASTAWTSTTRVGDPAKLEIFLATTTAGDTKIYIETNEAAGNALNKAEIATITLTGITSDKVSLVDGFVVIGGGI